MIIELSEICLLNLPSLIQRIVNVFESKNFWSIWLNNSTSSSGIWINRNRIDSDEMNRNESKWIEMYVSDVAIVNRFADRPDSLSR